MYAAFWKSLKEELVEYLVKQGQLNVIEERYPMTRRNL
jgi:hypothetical protein